MHATPPIGYVFSKKHHHFQSMFRTLLFLFFVGLTPLTAQVSRKLKLNPVALGFDLPESYKSRTFIKGLAGFVNNIDQLVGSMIVIEGNKTSVITRFVKEGKPPIVSTSTSDVLFNAKIDSKFRYNGSYAIASTKVERDAVYEVVITDIALAFLPEDYIPYLAICNAATNVSPDLKRKTYYVRSAKLTTVYTRAYRKVLGDVDVSGVAFSTGGEIYSSTDQFKVDYIVSVDLVSLEKLLSLQNCDQLAQSDELQRRERAEAARLAAAKAEEEKNARENDLAAVRSQVDELRRLLGQSVEQRADLQRQLADAQDRERTATTQAAAAQQQSDTLRQQAQQAQQSADNGEQVIVTFKNKEGKVLEIKSLEELSSEKIKELGFDVEILRER
jgi:hypothetical protein